VPFGTILDLAAEAPGKRLGDLISTNDGSSASSSKLVGE
jgi:hypothetical protein